MIGYIYIWLDKATLINQQTYLLAIKRGNGKSSFTDDFPVQASSTLSKKEYSPLPRVITRGYIPINFPVYHKYIPRNPQYIGEYSPIGDYSQYMIHDSLINIGDIYILYYIYM